MRGTYAGASPSPQPSPVKGEGEHLAVLASAINACNSRLPCAPLPLRERGGGEGYAAQAKQYSGVGNAPVFTSRTKFCTASCTDAAPFM